MLETILKSKIAKKILASSGSGQEICLMTSAKDLPEVLKFLKADKKLQFTQLLGICGADYPELEARLEIIYILLSISNNQRLRVKVKVAPMDMMPSICDLFANALWYERETYDMYGVLFKGNPDLRRILTDYGFEGHPLRKDFPLTGHVELRYDNELKKVVYEPVTLTQEFRNFDFESPWNGYPQALPGDEKASQ